MLWTHVKRKVNTALNEFAGVANEYANARLGGETPELSLFCLDDLFPRNGLRHYLGRKALAGWCSERGMNVHPDSAESTAVSFILAQALERAERS